MAVIMVSMTVLMTMTWVDDAGARAGRGGSSGSRGSRSYAAPARPSAAPALPGAPPARRENARGEPGATSREWTSGAAGLMAGGLLGGLLFGGRGAGMGLLDVVALGVVAYVALHLLRTRADGPVHAVYASVSDGVGGSRMAFADPGPRGDRSGAEAGVDPTRHREPSLDRAALAEAAAEMFEQVQHAWADRDVRPIAALLTPEMQASFQRDCDQLAARGQVNRVDGVSVDAAEILDAWQEKGFDWVTVRLGAQVVDYTVDEKTGQVVKGDASAPTAVDELWTLTRPIWAKGWRLSAIQQPVRAARRL
jgi:predicted lipid-binding transport protein (Tim44 family)